MAVRGPLTSGGPVVSAGFLIGHVHFRDVRMRDMVSGPERVVAPSRLLGVEEAGLGYTPHSDFMVTEPDPLHLIRMAVTCRTWKEPDFVLFPVERVSVESAIRAPTCEAACQPDREHEISGIGVGKLADLEIPEGGAARGAARRDRRDPGRRDLGRDLDGREAGPWKAAPRPSPPLPHPLVQPFRTPLSPWALSRAVSASVQPSGAVTSTRGPIQSCAWQECP